MKTLLILLASAVILVAADQVRLEPRSARPRAVVAAPKPQEANYGPEHKIETIPGVKIIITATNQFSLAQLRLWLHEAAQSIK